MISISNDEDVLDIRDLPRLIEEFRVALLCAVSEAGLCAQAEQYFLLTLSALDQAQRYSQLARIVQMQELARKPKGCGR